MDDQLEALSDLHDDLDGVGHTGPTPEFDLYALRAATDALRAANTATGAKKGRSRGTPHWNRLREQRAHDEKRLGAEGYERELRRRIDYRAARRHGANEIEARRFSYGHPPARKGGAARTARTRRPGCNVRRRGSRRTSSSSRSSGADPGDGEPEHEGRRRLASTKGARR